MACVISRVRDTDEVFAEVLELRRAVLYEPFGIPFDDDPTDADPDTVHVVAMEEGRVVGCGRLVPAQGGPRVRQLAVEPGRQGSGIGSALLSELVTAAAESGASEVWLAARSSATGFYEGHGFRVDGGDFETGTGIPHVRMARRLR